MTLTIHSGLFNPGRALRLLTLPGLLLLLAACDGASTGEALGTLERDLIRLTAPASEIITEVHVDEGDRVEAGAPLLQLDARAAQAELARAAAAEQRARAHLTQLQNGAREEELAAARARVANAEATASAEEKAYRRVEKLVQQDLLGQAELDQALARRDSARAALTDTREQLLLLQHGTREELIAQARAQLEEAKQAKIIARTRAGDLTVTATRSGRVDALPWHRGERVNAGAVVAILVPETRPFVRAYVPESALSRLQIGQQLPVRVDGVEERFSGRLTHIQQEPAFSPHYALTESQRSRLMYLVKVQLDDTATDLPGGIPAQVTLPAADTQP